MKKKTKIALIVILFLVAFAAIGYYYVMFGGARNLEDETASFELTATTISEEFTSNANLANKKYLEKAVSVSGNITSIEGSNVILDNTVICILNSSEPILQKNQNITLTGRVVGYDDLMGEVKLDQCFIKK